MKLQTKDIPDEHLLDLVGTLQTVRTAYIDEDDELISFKRESATLWDIHAMWPTIPKKVLLSKLDSLIRKGHISGCACGCRGDFEVIKKECGCSHTKA